LCSRLWLLLKTENNLIIVFSFLLAISATLCSAQIASQVVVEDFEKPLFPEWKSKSKNPEKIYNLKEENGDHYLSASSINDDNFIIKRFEVDLVKYPYLNWTWRAHSLPANGDESVKKHCDVAACINVVLKASKWRPRSIKYSWSTTLEPETRTKSPYAFWPSRCDIVVVKSGDSSMGVWHTEKVNVLEDYLKFYELDEVDSIVIEAIVIMTDSDNTKSLSAADYNDLYFSEK